MGQKANLEVKISKDLLTAYLTIIPPSEGGQPLTLAQIRNALLNKGVTYGIDEIKITIALAENKEIVDLPVAKGKVPIPGRDAQVKFHFNEKGLEIKPKELENGKVDFYNIDLIQNIKKGQLLLEKIPATKGIPGIAVTGKEIPAANGKDKILPIGRNLYVSEDNLRGYAACDGHVAFIDGKVLVLTVFEVNSDVDFSTGNIDFLGNVVIRGNIKDGFTVKAGGDIEIYGTVEGGHVFAEGNIIIKKGVRGLKKSKVETKGSVYSNFIENAKIIAGKDVIVNEAIMHSDVNSGSTIQVGGRKGLVVGGVCRAGKALICKNIGSSFATFTNIEVGIKPELRLKYKSVIKDLADTKESLDKTLKALKILEELKAKLTKLPRDKETLAARLQVTKTDLLKKQEELLKQCKHLEEHIKELEDGYIKVSETINCGVSITIGQANKHFTQEQSKVILTQNGMDISIAPLTD